MLSVTEARPKRGHTHIRVVGSRSELSRLLYERRLIGRTSRNRHGPLRDSVTMIRSDMFGVLPNGDRRSPLAAASNAIHVNGGLVRSKVGFSTFPPPLMNASQYSNNNITAPKLTYLNGFPQTRPPACGQNMQANLIHHPTR